MPVDPGTISLIIAVISIAITAISYLLQQQQQAPKQQAESYKLSSAGDPIPVMYGRGRSLCIVVFADEQPTSGSSAPSNDAGDKVNHFRNTIRAWPFGNSRDDFSTSKKREIQLSQHVICVGEIESVEVLVVDGATSEDEDKFKQFKAKNMNAGEVDIIATVFSPERDDNAKFTQLPYINFLAIQHPIKNPQWFKFPQVTAFILGRKLRQINLINNDYSFSDDETYDRNSIKVMLDYLTNNLYGPNILDNIFQLDHWYKTQQKAGTIIQGPGNVLWNMPYPAICNARYGTSYATWSEVFLSLGLENINDIGLAGDGSNNKQVPEFIQGPFGQFPNPEYPVNTGEATEQYWTTPFAPLLRYEFNGLINTSRNFATNIDQILASMPGVNLFINYNGKLDIKLPDSIIPKEQQSVKVIDKHVLVGRVKRTLPDANIKLNRVNLVYKDASKGLEEDTFVFPEEGSRLSISLLALDNGQRLEKELVVDSVVDIFHASSIAANIIFESRQPLYTFETRIKTGLLELGDIVNVIDLTVNINKFVVIIGIQDKLPTKTIAYTTREFEPCDYAYLPHARELAAPALSIPIVEPPEAVEVSVAEFDPRFVHITWIRPTRISTSELIVKYEVEISLGGQAWISVGIVDASDDDARAVFFNVGLQAISVIARVRSVAQTGIVSEWTLSNSVEFEHDVSLTKAIFDFYTATIEYERDLDYNYIYTGWTSSFVDSSSGINVVRDRVRLTAQFRRLKILVASQTHGVAIDPEDKEALIYLDDQVFGTGEPVTATIVGNHTKQIDIIVEHDESEIQSHLQFILKRIGDEPVSRGEWKSGVKYVKDDAVTITIYRELIKPGDILDIQPIIYNFWCKVNHISSDTNKPSLINETTEWRPFVDFDETQNRPVTFGESTIPNLTLRNGRAFLYRLPIAYGYDFPLIYSVSGLPDGLIFYSETRYIIGEVTNNALNLEIRYTVTDNNGDTDILIFYLSVTTTGQPPTHRPIFIFPTSNREFYVNEIITPFIVTGATLPLGFGVLTYEMPNLPMGLIFDPIERRISGTPTETGRYEVQYNAINTYNNIRYITYSTFDIRILVSETELAIPHFGEFGIGTHEIILGQTLEFIAPIGIGGNAPLSYTSIGGPGWLNFDPLTRRYHGTPNGLNAGSTVTYTVRDSDGDAATIRWRIVVVADPYVGETLVWRRSSASVSARIRRFHEVFRDEEGVAQENQYRFVLYLDVGGAVVRDSNRNIISERHVQHSILNSGGLDAVQYIPSGDTFFRVESRLDANNVYIPEHTIAPGYVIAYVERKTIQFLGEFGSPYDPPDFSDITGTFTVQIRAESTINGLNANIIRNVRITVSSSILDTSFPWIPPGAITTATADHVPIFNSKVGRINISIGVSYSSPPFSAASVPSGEGTLTYILIGIPLGLSFNSSSRVLSGTPTHAGNYDMFYQARNVVSGVAYVSELERVDIIITDTTVDPSLAEPTFGGILIHAPDAYALERFSIIGPQASGGNPPLTYYAENLPSWLNFDANTREFYGIPSHANIGRVSGVTFGVRDVDRDIDIILFSFSVLEREDRSETLEWADGGTSYGDISLIARRFSLGPERNIYVIHFSLSRALVRDSNGNEITSRAISYSIRIRNETSVLATGGLHGIAYDPGARIIGVSAVVETSTGIQHVQQVRDHYNGPNLVHFGHVLVDVDNPLPNNFIGTWNINILAAATIASDRVSLERLGTIRITLGTRATSAPWVPFDAAGYAELNYISININDFTGGTPPNLICTLVGSGLTNPTYLWQYRPGSNSSWINSVRTTNNIFPFYTTDSFALSTTFRCCVSVPGVPYRGAAIYSDIAKVIDPS